jgi:hypothetical protein
MRSVSSIRVPAGARTWSWICPPSSTGKKSRPTSGNITAPRPSTRTITTGMMKRWLTSSLSKRE